MREPIATPEEVERNRIMNAYILIPYNGNANPSWYIKERSSHRVLGIVDPMSEEVLFARYAPKITIGALLAQVMYETKMCQMDVTLPYAVSWEDGIVPPAPEEVAMECKTNITPMFTITVKPDPNNEPDFLWLRDQLSIIAEEEMDRENRDELITALEVAGTLLAACDLASTPAVGSTTVDLKNSSYLRGVQGINRAEIGDLL